MSNDGLGLLRTGNFSFLLTSHYWCKIDESED